MISIATRGIISVPATMIFRIGKITVSIRTINISVSID